jgi:hypothetical protein
VALGLAAAAAMDWHKALAEFKPAADAGDPNAEVNLGNLYMRGLAVTQNYGEAVKWYRKSAAQGSVVGQRKLGVCHFYGLGVSKDHLEAAHWFQKAAEQGDPESASVLGGLYDQGNGLPRDRVRAYFWYSVAAEYGHVAATDLRASMAGELTPAELNDGLARVAAWRQQQGITLDPADPKHPPDSRSDQQPASKRKTGKGKGHLPGSSKRIQPK